MSFQIFEAVKVFIAPVNSSRYTIEFVEQGGALTALEYLTLPNGHETTKTAALEILHIVAQAGPKFRVVLRECEGTNRIHPPSTLPSWLAVSRCLAVVALTESGVGLWTLSHTCTHTITCMSTLQRPGTSLSTVTAVGRTSSWPKICSPPYNKRRSNASVSLYRQKELRGEWKPASSVCTSTDEPLD
jgi:hypothetical protein